jgi:hypothetical protein
LQWAPAADPTLLERSRHCQTVKKGEKTKCATSWISVSRFRTSTARRSASAPIRASSPRSTSSRRSSSQEPREKLAERLEKVWGAEQTLATICVSALLAAHEEEKKLGDDERIRRFELSRRLNKGGLQEFNDKERDLLKKVVGMRFLGSLVPPTVWEMLEGAERLGELKDVSKAARPAARRSRRSPRSSRSRSPAARRRRSTFSNMPRASPRPRSSPALSRRSAARSSRPTSSPSAPSNVSRKRRNANGADHDYPRRGVRRSASRTHSAGG